MSDLRALRTYAWSMSQLPGMPPGAPPTQGRGTCMSCGGGTYKGRLTCLKCEKSQVALSRRFARVPVPPRPRVSCWICVKLIISHGAKRPACRECHQKHGSGICSECGAPKRLDTPGLCRNCHDKQRAAIPALPRVCELCTSEYVPKYRPRADRPGQRFCSKSCKRAWQNGARPPFDRFTVVGLPRKRRHDRIRRQRRAETWDGVTDAEIMERDRWRCGICRKVIGKSFKWPHPRSASVDHIVPISEGGADTAGNKRAAHLGCNCGRMNRGGGEQAALF